MPEEEWRRIEEAPQYAVSDQGRIYSYRRKKVMELPVQTAGYLQVGLYHEKKRVKRMVSHLVMRAFDSYVEEFGLGDRRVVHLDGNPANCALSNLSLMSRSELAHHHRDNFAKKNKLDMVKAREIRHKSSEGSSLSTLSKEYGVSTSNIHSVIHGDTWKEDR
jgi:hypothetical protein